MHPNLNTKRIISVWIIFAFLANIFPFPIAQADEFVLPKPGVMVGLSGSFKPVVMRGIKIDPANPFRFNFLVDEGDTKLKEQDFKDEAQKVIKYFLTSLTIPDNDLWVNLSPYEKNRIIPQSFGQTEMGRDLLAQDYILKQITASLIYPENEIGKKFWAKVYKLAQQKHGSTNIPINTFNKVWIVPDHATVYQHQGTAFVLNYHLEVMLEQDYLALDKNKIDQPNKKEVISLSLQVVRSIVLPELEKEVNSGKNFASLRQVFYSLILATWYKTKVKQAILNQVYADKEKVAGILVDDQQDKEKIYQQYLQAFKKGVFNYVKEDLNTVTNETIPRKYFSGGVLGHIDPAVIAYEPQFQFNALSGMRLRNVSGEVGLIKENNVRNNFQSVNGSRLLAKVLEKKKEMDLAIQPRDEDTKPIDNAMNVKEVAKKTLGVLESYSNSKISRREFAKLILTGLGAVGVAATGMALSIELGSPLGKNQERVVEETYDVFKKIDQLSNTTLKKRPELLKKNFVVTDLKKSFEGIGISIIAYIAAITFFNVKGYLKNRKNPETKINRQVMMYKIFIFTQFLLEGLIFYLMEPHGMTLPQIKKVMNSRVLLDKQYEHDVVNQSLLFTVAHEISHMLEFPGNDYLANGYALLVANRVAFQRKMPAVTLLGLAQVESQNDVKEPSVYRGYYLAKAAMASGAPFYQQETGIRKIADDHKLREDFISLKDSQTQNQFFIQVVNGLKEDDYKIPTIVADGMNPWVYTYGAAMGEMALGTHKSLEEGLNFLYHLGEIIEKDKKIDSNVPGLKADNAQMGTVKDLKGGIDFTSKRYKISIESDGQDLKMDFDPAMVRDLQFDGVEFHIDKVSPVTNPQVYLLS